MELALSWLLISSKTNIGAGSHLCVWCSVVFVASDTVRTVIYTEVVVFKYIYVCNSVLYNDLQGFYRYSAAKWQACFDRQSL